MCLILIRLCHVSLTTQCPVGPRAVMASRQCDSVINNDTDRENMMTIVSCCAVRNDDNEDNNSNVGYGGDCILARK